MHRIVSIIIIMLTCFMPLLVSPATDQSWSGMLNDGTTISKNELDILLEEHKAWIASDQEDGIQLQLPKADLTGAQLQGEDLRGVDLQGADLVHASLVRADLRGANMRDANLIMADLSGADLREADLREASLIRANLKGAKIQGAKLEKAILTDTEIDVSFSKNSKWQTVWELLNKNENEADNAARRKRLRRIDLSHAFLRGLDLKGADLSQTDLREADLNGADLSHTNLHKADLRNASLIYADLRNANLIKADIGNALLTEAKMDGAVFEPKTGSLPDIEALSTARDLSKLRWEDSPHALFELREAFKKVGLTAQERRITYAINRSLRQAEWRKDHVLIKLKSLFTLIFFEFTCGYGTQPFKALFILVGFIPFFSIFYIFALNSKRRKTGIWLIFPRERVLKTTKKERPFKLTAKFPPRIVHSRVKRFGRMIKVAFYFSLLSAFSIGIREFHVGNWFSRLQRREYLLKATGWVRTVSGLQSLLSAYLLAIWIVTFLVGFIKGFE